MAQSKYQVKKGATRPGSVGQFANRRTADSRFNLWPLPHLDLYIHENPTGANCANSGLTETVNLNLEHAREFFRVSPHHVGRDLASLGLTDRKRTNSGWVLRVSRDTRDRIHGLIRRNRVEIDSSVNRESRDFCMGRKNPQPGPSEPSPGSRTTPSSVEGQAG
jgi:hypothetical protein